MPKSGTTRTSDAFRVFKKAEEIRSHIEANIKLIHNKSSIKAKQSVGNICAPDDIRHQLDCAQLLHQVPVKAPMEGNAAP